jgi:hypothetical protein
LKQNLQIILIMLALLLSEQAGVQAQSGDYDLTGSIVVSGSAISGGAYTVDGAAGQPDTGTLNGGDYSLGGGFFGGGVIAGGSRRSIYLPLMRH